MENIFAFDFTIFGVGNFDCLKALLLFQLSGRVGSGPKKSDCYLWIFYVVTILLEARIYIVTKHYKLVIISVKIVKNNMY